MNPTGLELLRDIHPPPDPSIWPPAPGWWFASLLIIIFLTCRPQITRYVTGKSLRRQTLRTLGELKARAGHDADAAVTGDLSLLIRQVALRKFPEDQCAGITGEAWLDFLRKTDEGEAMESPLACRLLDAPYERQPQIEIVDLVELGGSWIKQHA